MQTNQQQHEVGGGGVELSPTSNNTSSPQTTTRPTDITIAFKNLSVTERTFADPEPYNNVYQSVANGVLSGGKTFQLGDFHRLRDASGIITPGSMTLVLSSAGGGRTTYLKALSQRLKTTQDAFLVNGEDIAKINADGAFDLKKAVQYADQIDTLQLPLLTVYETLEFAAKLSNKDHSDEAVKNKVEYVISTLGLTESQHTIIGDESTRGIRYVLFHLFYYFVYSCCSSSSLMMTAVRSTISLFSRHLPPHSPSPSPLPHLNLSSQNL